MDSIKSNPDNIEAGMLVKSAIMPNTVFTVSQILCHDVDLDGKKFVCGYLQSDKLSKVSFAYKEGCTDYVFYDKPVPLMKHDIYRHSTHLIRNSDRSKFPYHEIGAEGVLLSKYYGAIDKARILGVPVYRYDYKCGKYLTIPI